MNPEDLVDILRPPQEQMLDVLSGEYGVIVVWTDVEITTKAWYMAIAAYQGGSEE